MRSAIQDVKPRRGPTPQLIDGITKSEHRQKLHGEVTTTLAELRASRTAAKTGALSLMYVTKAKDKEAIARHKEALKAHTTSQKAAQKAYDAAVKTRNKFVEKNARSK
jgi:hypothetical protein